MKLPDGRFLTKRVPPSGTAYDDNCYSLAGYSPEHAEFVEKNFLSPLDNAAADAMRHLCERGDIREEKLRLGWVRFITSLLMRMPEDVELLRDSYRKFWLITSEKHEAEYQAIRFDGAPPTLAEALRERPLSEVGRMEMQQFIHLIDNKTVIKTIYEMRWDVLNVENHAFQLLVSDRPVLKTNRLDSEESFLVLPIGPKLLFVAYNEKVTHNKIRGKLARLLVSQCNEAVTVVARKYVFGTSDAQRVFVERRFGTQREPSLVERIIAHMREERGLDENWQPVRSQ